MQEGHIEAEDAAVCVQGELGLVQLGALLIGSDEVLAAILDPFDRPLEHSRHRGRQHVFGVAKALVVSPPPPQCAMRLMVSHWSASFSLGGRCGR